SQAARTDEISGVHWGGTAMVVEVATCVHGVPPLPMGIGRVDRHEGAGLQTTDLEGVKGSIKALDFWGQWLKMMCQTIEPRLSYCLWRPDGNGPERGCYGSPRKELLAVTSDCDDIFMESLTRGLMIKSSWESVTFWSLKQTYANNSLIAFKLVHRSWAILPSTRATGRYGLGDTSTAYVNLIALPPTGEHPGSGCILQTP
ncbi:hypothetical protein THAOC_31702, partial [Thalassiosira oceanica]